MKLVIKCNLSIWDQVNSPDYRGVLISGMNLYYKAQFGTFLFFKFP